MSEIEIIPLLEALRRWLPEVHKFVTTHYADWKMHGPYCPGKVGYHTFLAEKDGKRVWLLFGDNGEVIEEEFTHGRKETDSGCSGSGG